MLDAVRISGRWIRKSVLEQMTERTLEPDPPTRQQWLQEFCRRTDWRNRKGELCSSSANVGVQRLEKLGLVRWPAAAPRAPRSARRQLVDDGQALPPLPQLPASAEQISDLHLHLIRNQRESEHKLAAPGPKPGPGPRQSWQKCSSQDPQRCLGLAMGGASPRPAAPAASAGGG